MTQLAQVRESAYSEMVAAEVRSAIARKLLTQKQVAELLGIPYASMNHRWHGKTPWRVDELAVLAERLDMDVADFMPRTTTARRRGADGPFGVHPPGLEPGTQWLRALAGQAVAWLLGRSVDSGVELAEVVDLDAYRERRAS